MNAVIIFTLAYMLILFGTIAFRLCRCSRTERMKRLKSFKHGEFALIYFSVIPLYFLAQRFNGQSVDGAFWLSVEASIDVVALGFDYTTVAPLAAQNLLFHITIEVLYILVVLNTLMFTLSFCGQWLYNQIVLLLARKSKKTVVVIGTNENALDILGSVPRGHRAILFGALTPELRDEAYRCKAAAYPLKEDDDIGFLLCKLFGKFQNRKVSAILADENDERSLLRVKQLCRMIKSEGLIRNFDNEGLCVHVFASKGNEDVFAHYVEESNGVIRFINRHKQIAMDFISRYPMTQFMTNREIDTKTATIRDKIDLNVFMIGFGKLNESLFLASVSNNQFLAMRDGKLQPKPVTYHIYDRYYPQGKFTEKSKVHSGALHHGYLRYEEFLKHAAGQENAYLELLPMPANMIEHPLEVTHPDFYTSMRPILLKENSYHYIIISFGTDMENIELAEKLQQKIKEWDVPSPYKIFVKVRDAKVTKQLGKDFEKIVFFGSNSECVYNAEAILHEKVDYMARLQHLLYTAENEVKRSKQSNPTALTNATIREAARQKWYSYKEYQRESNTYACLSARVKLQLCGFDIAETGEDCTERFLQAYQARDDRTVYDPTLKVEGKIIWKYSNAEQFRPSRRFALAAQEHLRWCANMIASGLIPCRKDELTLEKNKLLEKRKHGNLTTMEGLKEFRKIVADATGKTEEETDVIRYDYQLMDDIDWLLKKCGYKIVKKNMGNENNCVFVSYEQGSKSIADSIVSSLEAEKIGCRYAPCDGGDCADIADAIENASIFVLVLNGAASRSHLMLNEVALVAKKNDENPQPITILPFKVSDDEISPEMEYYLKDWEWIDATPIGLETGIADLKKKIMRLLGI